MAKRTPVSRLDISGISTAPTARPVETYVRPAEIQSQPSALTEFVQAITPAVKAVADKQLETKLKREREIESFRLKSKYKQAELKSYEMHLKINQDYKDNADTWHEMKTEDVLTKITNYQDSYLDSLPPETDPLLKETMKLQFQEYNVKTIADFNAGKTQYNNNKLNNSFKDTITLALTADEENTVPTIQKMIDDFAIANPLPNGKADYKRAVNVAHDLLLDMSVDNADNKLYDALDTMKTKDGKKLNVMDTGERAKNTAIIRARRDKQIKTRLVVSNKAEGIQSRINDSVTNRKRIVKTYTDLQGNVKTFTDNELEQSLFKNEAFMSLSEGEKYQAFRDMGFVPPSIKNKVLDGLTFLIAGDVSTPETNQAIENSFLNYMALKNSGNDLSFINKEDRLRFEAMDFWVNKSAKVGEIDILQEQTEEQVFEDEPPAVIRSKNYNNAARNIQMMNFDIKKSPDFTKNIKDKMNEVSPLSDDLSEVSNSSFIQNEIATTAHYLIQSGMGEEEAIEKAVEIAKKDYPVVESGNGKAYGFNHLNTGVDSSLNPSEIIPKYNKLLLDSKKVKQYMLDTHGLKGGEFDIAIYPDPKNPNAAVIMAFDDEGLPLGQVGGSINKNVLLSDQQQLNNLIATGMTQDVSTTTTYTPDVNKVVINSTSQNVIEQALAQVDDFQQFQPTPTDEPVVGQPMLRKTLQSLEQRDVTDTSKKLVGSEIMNTVQKGIESALNYVLGSTSAAQQNSEIIGEFIEGFTTKSSNKIIDIISSEIDKAKQEYEKKVTLNKNSISNMPSNQAIGNKMTIEGSNIEEKTANMIATQEGFSSTPYKDGKNKSVGFGFYLPSLEEDEKALIKDVNNVTREEATQVLNLKVQKIGNYLEKEIQGFRNLPEEAQSAIISMGYQLGVTNIPKTWKNFTAAIKEAGQYEEGSPEQAEALAKAKFEMLYSRTKDGKIVLNKWARQTKERAFEMANAVSDAELPL